MVNKAIEGYRPGSEKRALSLMAKAAELQPGLREAHYNCALLYEQVGEARRAAVHWARLIQLSPDSKDAAIARQHLYP